MGRPFETIKGNGIKSVSLFDGAGRLTQIADPGTSTDNPSICILLRYTYDANGNIIQVSAAEGTQSFTYDGLNRLTSWTDETGTTTTYTYDKVGNLTKKGSKTYTYNAASQITNSG
ncbi:MAG: RHS repeat protein, partial [Actinobacteria bacterium]|nr:RHS repeat protein [Actinomycetota bacterium]